MIKLPNGCSCSDLAVYPSDWEKNSASTEKPWYIQYRFYDSDKKCKQIAIRGMNHHSELEVRQDETSYLLKQELSKLKRGFNPITKELPVDYDQEVGPETSLYHALEYIYKKIKCFKHTTECLKSMISCSTASAKKVNVYTMPVGQVKRKHIVKLLDQCSTDRKLSASNYNHYRAYLMRLFKALVKMEAIESNPVTAEIEKEKEIKKIRELLTSDERALIDNHLQKTYYNFRRYVNIFFHSGCRTAEMFRIKGKDVNLATRSFKITLLKGNQKMEVLKLIKDTALPFWQEVMETCKPDDYVFSLHYTPGHKHIRAERPTKDWVKYVQAPEEKGGLGIDKSFYILKHTASDETAKLLSIEHAKKQNSHKSVKTTKIYAVGEGDREAEEIRALRNKFS